MKRWLAVLLLVVVATFLAAAAAGLCEDGRACHDQKAPHLLCVDDCAPAVLPKAPAPPPPDPMPKLVYEAKVSLPLLQRDLEPEKTPPRA
jgi:hypothetical protein